MAELQPGTPNPFVRSRSTLLPAGWEMGAKLIESAAGCLDSNVEKPVLPGPSMMWLAGAKPVDSTR
jgi:hypothetical protein